MEEEGSKDRKDYEFTHNERLKLAGDVFASSFNKAVAVEPSTFVQVDEVRRRLEAAGHRVSKHAIRGKVHKLPADGSIVC